MMIHDKILQHHLIHLVISTRWEMALVDSVIVVVCWVIYSRPLFLKSLCYSNFFYADIILFESFFVEVEVIIYYVFFQVAPSISLKSPLAVSASQSASSQTSVCISCFYDLKMFLEVLLWKIIIKDVSDFFCGILSIM